MTMWSGIEACASVICANLPSYAPLLRSRTNKKSVLARIRTILSTRTRLDSNPDVSPPKGSLLKKDIVDGRPAVENQARGEMEVSLELGDVRANSLGHST